MYIFLNNAHPSVLYLLLFPLDRSFLKLAEEDYTGLPNDVSSNWYTLLSAEEVGLVSCTRPLPPQLCWWCNTSRAGERVVWYTRLEVGHASPMCHVHQHKTVVHSCVSRRTQCHWERSRWALTNEPYLFQGRSKRSGWSGFGRATFQRTISRKWSITSLMVGNGRHHGTGDPLDTAPMGVTPPWWLLYILGSSCSMCTSTWVFWQEERWAQKVTGS